MTELLDEVGVYARREFIFFDDTDLELERLPKVEELLRHALGDVQVKAYGYT